MIPTISQACSMHSDFVTDVEEYAAAGCESLEIWLTKLETYLQRHALDEAQRLLEKHQIQCPVASYQGGLFQSEGLALNECWEHFSRRLEICAGLAVEVLVVAVDIDRPLAQPLLHELPAQLATIADAAAEHNLRIALEFQHNATVLNNLRSLAEFLLALEKPNLGICLDAMYFQRSCSKESDLHLLNAGNLFHVQVCDCISPMRELMSNRDRILPGDGSFEYRTFFERVRQSGYEGPVSVELHNPMIYAIPPRQFAEVALTSLERLW